MRPSFIALLITSLALAPAGAGGTSPALIAAAAAAPAQESDAQKRTREIVALLSKRRHMVKEKFGVRKERYKEIRGEPVVKEDVKAYSGNYEVPDLGFALHIRVGGDGRVEASGFEQVSATPRHARRFTLKDAKLEGALLTATKVYTDGTTDKFEGVFINLIDIEGMSPDRIERGASTFGLGVIGVRVEKNGVSSDKLFYHFKQ